MPRDACGISGEGGQGMTERPIEAYKLDDIRKYVKTLEERMADIETDVEIEQSFYDGFIMGMKSVGRFMDEWKY